MDRKLKVYWKLLYLIFFNLVYIFKVIINYFFQNVSLVLIISSIFFYVTVIFGAPPIKTAKLWCAIFRKGFLSKKPKYGKTVFSVHSSGYDLRTYNTVFPNFVFSLRNRSPKIDVKKVAVLCLPCSTWPSESIEWKNQS